jgi:hypothetical protein
MVSIATVQVTLLFQTHNTQQKDNKSLDVDPKHGGFPNDRSMLFKLITPYQVGR